MKREWVGWIGRGYFGYMIRDRKWNAWGNPPNISMAIKKTRGKKEEWTEGDWPPIKVRLILEEVE